jgi:conjugal transfer/entry exclusion protein
VADGMSLQGNKLTIMNNVFRNNTDVDLIVWGSSKSDIYFNSVIHDNANYFAYAAMMLNTFGASPWREAFG